MLTQISPKTMTMQEIYQRLIEHNDLFIVDVRNEEDFASWHIETAEQIDIINVPYFDFLEEEAEALAKVQTDKEVVVVCAKEGSSAFGKSVV